MDTNRSRPSARASTLAAALALLAAGCSSVTYTTDYDQLAPVAASATWAWRPPAGAQAQALADISLFLERRIERAVEQNLASSGFTRTDSARPDYYVTAYPILPDRTARGTATGNARRQTRVSVGVGLGFWPYGPRYPYAPYGFRSWPYGVWPAYGYWHPYAWYMGPGWGWGPPYYGYGAWGWGPTIGMGWQSWNAPPPPARGWRTRGPGTLAIDVIDASSGAVVWEGLAEGALLDMPSGKDLDPYVDEVVSRTLRDFPPGS